MSAAIRIHPSNPKLFEFRGKPLVLLTATEHYGAVMNRPFRFELYLADAAEKHITLTRLFVLFRELQSSINPISTCKPETPDYIAPFRRTGPGRARDLELKYDLDQPNPEFYDRLGRFIGLAATYGIIVEVVLLSNTYAPNIWDLNPLKASNNINGLDEIEWPEYMSQRHPKLFERQAAHVRRIVEATNHFDNVIYEICNEPGGCALGRPTDPTVAEVNDWLTALMGVVRETEAGLPNQHLIAGLEAFQWVPWQQGAEASFQTLDYDIVNMHPVLNVVYAGRSYRLSDFMSKQLGLRELRDFGLATYSAPKPLNQDEDNIASQYKDAEAWTIHRKRAWTTLFAGGHYDYIDFSIVNGLEAGTPESQRHIRTWMKHLSIFIHSLDLTRAKPMPGLVAEQPENTLDVVFGVAGEDYCLYLADERELAAARDLADDQVERGAGQPITGWVRLRVPTGHYRAALFDPQTGLYSPAIQLEADRNGARIELPTFVHDLVVRLTRL